MPDFTEVITKIRDEERWAFPYKTKLRVLMDHIGDIHISHVAHTIAMMYLSKEKILRRVKKYGLTMSVVVDMETNSMAGMLIDDIYSPGWVLSLLAKKKKVVEDMPLDPRTFFGHDVWSCLKSITTSVQNSMRYGGPEDYGDNGILNVWAQACDRCGQDSAFFGPLKCKMCAADEMAEALIEEERVQKIKAIKKRVQKKKNIIVPSTPILDKAIDFVIDSDDETLEALGFVFNEILVR